jgi:hypothetical protein
MLPSEIIVQRVESEIIIDIVESPNPKAQVRS